MSAKILGKLRGLIASASENSRNNRHYTERFWDGIINSDIFQEGIENKMYFGELWHPDNDEEYGQVHPGDNAAIVLTKVDKKGLDYYGEFDILPTRAGEVLKNLIDIGCTFGVSSRGYSDYDSTIFDDPSQYDLITWDIVAFPGIKSARLHPISAVSESFTRRKTNKKKVMENLNRIISENNKEVNNYIFNTIKKLSTSEDYDTDLQIEDLIASNSSDYIFSSADFKDYAIVVNINDKLVPIYDDGIHGESNVIFYDDSVIKDAKIGDEILVDDIFYDDNLDAYKTFDSGVNVK